MPVAMETPETEQSLFQELMTLIKEGMTPNEVYGVMALVKSMRRNKNVMMKTEAPEGTERYAIYEEDEGWHTKFCWILGISRQSISQGISIYPRISSNGICYKSE